MTVRDNCRLGVVPGSGTLLQQNGIAGNGLDGVALVGARDTTSSTITASGALRPVLLSAGADGHAMVDNAFTGNGAAEGGEIGVCPAATTRIQATARRRPSRGSRSGRRPGGRAVDCASPPRVEYLGGPFLRHPRMVTITFATDDPQLVPRLAHFGDTITRTAGGAQSPTATAPRRVTASATDKPGGPSPSTRRCRPASGRGRLRPSRGLSGRRLGALDPDTLLLSYLPPAVALSMRSRATATAARARSTGCCVRRCAGAVRGDAAVRRRGAARHLEPVRGAARVVEPRRVTGPRSCVPAPADRSYVALVRSSRRCGWSAR